MFAYNSRMGNPPVQSDSADVHQPAANTAAIVTYAASETKKHVISGIAWSYDAAPTAGSLTVKDGADTIFVVSVTAAGPGIFVFPHPKAGSVNKAMTITLAAGGASATGKVSVINHWTE